MVGEDPDSGRKRVVKTNDPKENGTGRVRPAPIKKPGDCSPGRFLKNGQLLAVIVEALARLAAELARTDHLL